MAFPLPNNPYFSTSPLADVAEFRQNLVSRIFGRPQDYDLSLAPSQSPELLRRSDLVNPQKTLCTPNNLLNSPGWFQHALASSLQMGLLSLPRYMLKDIYLPPLPSQPLNMRLPRATNIHAPFEPSVPEVKPKITSKCASRPEHSRSSSFNDCENFFACRQPTVRPTLKRQSERPKTNWGSNSTSNPLASVESQDTGTLVPSLIDGEVIMGFNVWGEKRLCLPHLFRFVLHDVDLQIIDKACTKLQIACTTCTPAQLSLLHSRQILPRTVGSCGLIRKSDAERLTKYIRHQNMCLEGSNCEESSTCKSPINPCIGEDSEMKTTAGMGFIKDHRQLSPVSTDTFKSTKSVDNAQSADRLDSGHDENQPENNCKNAVESSVIPVIHECFGRQLGLIYPNMYKEPYSKCIKCVTCCRYFSPEQFVGHTHTVTEVDNLNHWGFDSTNWRCYLRLYTGRRLNVNVNSILSNINTVRGHEVVGKSNTKEPVVAVDAHRRLEEFKIKFAQPIKLPPSLGAALRSVGLCASVAPFPAGTTNSQHSQTSEASICEQISALIRKTSQSKTHQFLPLRPNKALDQTIISTSANSAPNQSSPSNMMLPQLTLRRLWAPNDGRIKLPPPPRLLTSCEIKSLPEKFRTGPPLLLHSHRVVTQDAAHHYDRDFIPNVCLKPFNGTDSKNIARSSSSRRRRHRRSLRKQSEGDSIQDSRSRSCSEYSSGSRSSRTRSSSASSTSSSRCSCNKITGNLDIPDFRWNQNKPSCNCNHNSTSPKPNAHRTTDGLKSCGSMCVKKNPSNSCSPRLSRARSLSGSVNKFKRLRRTSSCPMFYSIRQTSTLNNIECSDDKHNRKKLTNSTSTFKAYQKKSAPPHMDKSGIKQRCKAMAAARAAQGAASRTGPGLWARHFINVQNSNGDSMKLPNARRSVPHTVDTHNPYSNPVNNTPVLVTNPMKNSLPAAVLALEAIWADLVRLINEYTIAVESRSGVDAARQRLFEQFISMQTCYATHIASLMDENQKLHEKLTQTQTQLLHCQPQLQGFVTNNNNNTSMPLMSNNAPLASSQPPLLSTITTSSTSTTSAGNQNQFHAFDTELDNKSGSNNRSDDMLIHSVIQNNNNVNNYDGNNNNLSRLSRNDFSPLIIDPTRIISSINKLKSMNSGDETHLRIASAMNTTASITSNPHHKHHFTSNNSMTDPGNSSSRYLTMASSMLSSNLKRKIDSSNNLDFDIHRSMSSSSLPSVQDRLDSNVCPETLQSSSNPSPLEGGRSHSSSTPTASETDSLTRDPVDDPSEEINHLEFQNPNPRINIEGDTNESNVWTKTLPTLDKSSMLWDQHQNPVRNLSDLTANCMSKHRDTSLIDTTPPNQTIYSHQPKKRRTLNSHIFAATNSNINSGNNNKCNK
ncbi:unnamed protein product [Schistosoma guineensis]|nr:unnamed protein product [Schistosoma guineensis]